ncbi:MAG: exonuclease domain-containing protein [Bdellovibrionota bacterium]
MIKKDLPPRYYLDHFQDMIGAIRKGHFSFLEEKHHSFLLDFDSLSEDGRCLYVRFVNRKGKYFFRETLRYPEIGNLDLAIVELKEKRFLTDPTHADLSFLFEGLAKEKLLEFCEHYLVPLKKSWPKPRFLEELNKLDLSNFPLEKLGQCLVQERLDELSYLLFLYFGEISNNLSLYTLRDLGIWSENKRTDFVPKFTSRSEALSHYFYARLLDEIDTENYDHELISTWPEPVKEESLHLRENLLVALGEELKKNGNHETALAVYEHSRIHPGRERRIRLLYQMGNLERTLAELHTVMEDPSSDEELLFAEDFLERKFHQKKKTVLSQMLDEAATMSLDEAYFRQPEEGVRDTLRVKGLLCHHSENALWRTLFGVLFWHEIFESPLNTFHSPFERLPEELSSSQFYVKHHSAIQEKLLLLNDPENLKIYIEKLKEEKDSEKNGIFSWHDDNIIALLDLVMFASPEKISSMMIYLAEDFHRRIRGFPDLIAVEDGEVKFIEVKAPGDSLRGHQLMQMNVLRHAGFPVELLKVEYKLNPEQTYVVVDLETTGGLMPYHRITEIGAVKLRGGEVIGTFQSLINPQRKISLEIQELTGITNEMVKTAPLFKDVAESFREFCEDAIFVAHNVQFDYGFLQAEYGRLEERFVKPFLCTKVLMKKYYPGLASYSLANLTAHFEVPLVQHHRALCDAEATAKLFVIINQRR